MSWLEHHQTSEVAASAAEAAIRLRDYSEAERKFFEAAEAETRALNSLEDNKVRTRGITAVSAVSLWFKAKAYETAEALAYKMMAAGNLPEFATTDLRALLQSIWTEFSKQEAGVTFLPGQVLVSVKGGQVITGGAPLDLIVEKVQTVQSLFYRTIELVKDMPHRVRGAADRLIQDSCRPWLFQTPPGSYQFAVGIEKPKQLDFFDTTHPQEIAERFLQIVAATTTGDLDRLTAVVPNEEYRNTFLKLSRNLAPTSKGQTFTDLEIKAAGETRGISLGADTRLQINKSLRALQPKKPVQPGVEAMTITGILRGVELDQDWLEITTDAGKVHVGGVQDTIDDVIGPMVNHRVLVSVLQKGSKYTFVDIEKTD